MNSNEFSKNTLDYRELTKPYFKKWYWFVICVIVALILGILKIRYTNPAYAITSKIQILDDKSSNSELAAFSELQLFGGGGKEIIDEIEILGSRTNFVAVAKKLGLNIKITELGNLRNSEQYRNPSFKINFIEPDSIIYQADANFIVKPISNTNFEFSLDKEEEIKTYSYGKRVKTPAGEVIITPNVPNPKNLINRDYKIGISPLVSVAEMYQTKVEITTIDEMSSKIISISVEDAIEQRGRDVINTLVAIYNQNAIDDKKAIADRTSTFINDRIGEIYGDLSNVDENAEEFKSGKGIADIATQTSVNLNLGANSQQELQNASVQLDIASSMKDLLDGQEGYELLPANVGIADPTIATTTARYNELALQRKRLLESSNEKNPIIVNLDQQLDGLKRSMKSSLNSVENNLSLQVNSLSSQLSKINSRIYSAPKNERALRDITRQQQTIESLYLYLLQKREESQITFASASPKSKIIDSAYLVSKNPVTPKKPIILLASLIFGFLVPFSIIYLNELIDNKIHNKLDLESIGGSIPVMVEVPKVAKGDSKLVRKDDRSVLSESLRILRTNLNYVQKSQKVNPDNIFYVTSSVPGEGKTFISSNLSAIYASTGKKVLLIGADIRSPKIHEFFSPNKDSQFFLSNSNKTIENGLTEFLINQDLVVSDIITRVNVNDYDIDIIFSGKIPPNPTELLMSDRLGVLFQEVSKDYDYVIVDTAPMMVVTDTVLISEYASQILYVVKAHSTEKKVIDFPKKLKQEGKIKGLSFIVNNVKQSELGYGGKYGYGYGQEVKPWWKFYSKS